MPRLLIVDDHPLFRTGVVRALEDAMGFEDVVEVGSKAEAEAKLSTGAFDLAILDLGLPDGSGLDILESFGGRPGSPRFFVLTMDSNRGSVRRALQRGASGYSTKTIALGTLILGLKLVLEGELFVETELLRDLLTPSLRETVASPELRSRLESLTSRERECLDAFLGGLTMKQIAARLGVSQRTAENYQSSIYSKAGVNTPVELIKFAQRLGLTLGP
jgi:two-component system, NarL family, invasion response regulator UvrY